MEKQLRTNQDMVEATRSQQKNTNDHKQQHQNKNYHEERLCELEAGKTRTREKHSCTEYIYGRHIMVLYNLGVAMKNSNMPSHK